MIGIIGAGKRARILAKAFPKDTKFVVTSKSNKSAKQFANDFNASICKIENILDNYNIKTVVIATPIDTLDEIVEKCIDAKKNIFAEKPGCTSSKIAELIHQKALINSCIARAGFSWNDEVWVKSFTKNWDKLNIYWCKNKTAHEDITLNLACHPISWALNTVQDCHVIYTKINKHSDKFISYEVELSSSKRIFLTIEIKENLCNHRHIEMFTKDEYFQLKDDGKILSSASGIKTSAEKQINSFISDIEQCKIKGERDFAHVSRVLKTLGR